MDEPSAGVSPSGAEEPISEDCVELWRPRFEDVPWLVELRNRRAVRQWFHHSEVILPEVSGRWISARMTDDDDALRVLRVCGIDQGLGTIGWERSRTEPDRYEVGRLVLDTVRLRGLPTEVRREVTAARLTDAACRAVQEHLFMTRGAQALTVTCKAGNLRGRHVAERGGAVMEGVSDDSANYVVLRGLWLERRER
ncbi:MAG: GNAT family N-acetyltransferase [Prosthecobacter sp.]|jgi:RimJ/RimL family protein N-acetyltransferase|uniref:GNAT family N-acetyltransferase n=1 Tax=Prosthecobacter sp. TaxID=1965333 RepID=UPI0019DC2CED|nr:GNAT family protein [Prosthecobacter sp.]MBE2286010.1 GNAT family N-acetyltransferase [Prosthecobacter sp.]